MPWEHEQFRPDLDPHEGTLPIRPVFTQDAIPASSGFRPVPFRSVNHYAHVNNIPLRHAAILTLWSPGSIIYSHHYGHRRIIPVHRPGNRTEPSRPSLSPTCCHREGAERGFRAAMAPTWRPNPRRPEHETCRSPAYSALTARHGTFCASGSSIGDISYHPDRRSKRR